MNFKKAATIATAVGALAAVSVPAFALENEFHGMYRLRAMMSNYENAAGGALLDDASTLTVFEQRARLQYTAKANADLKLVTQFEIDSSWGDAAYSNGRGTGGAMGADTVNLETKHVYLDYNCPLTGANFKVGIQAQSDAYKGVLFNDDLAGIFAAKKFGAVTATAGFARLEDAGNASPVGKKTNDLFLLDAKFAVSKDLSVGGSYYLVRTDILQAKASDMHMVGVNAAAKFGIVNADAFVAYQGGKELYSATRRDVSAFAAQVGAKVNLDKAGTVRADVLYLSGDDGAGSTTNAWQTMDSGVTSSAALTSASNNYYGSKMMLLVRNVYNMDSDKALVYNLSNLTLLTAGYDAKISDKLGASVNLGYAMLNEKGALSSSSIGTELNAQVDYKMFDNLTASLQAAYVFVGDGAVNGTGKGADDPYLTALMLNYTF
ncbi:MAG: hypothetical protein PHH91_09340 [Desulfuromonadaceae bacterium]|nr:hypothetical protein [Desulfuromonadaceae bacterium]